MKEVYQGNFTTYFSTWLKDKSTEVDGETIYENVEKVKSLFQLMPDIPFTKRTGEIETMTFAERFMERNWYKEIGSETFELFEMQLTIKSREVASLFAEKIRSQLEHFSKLYDRFIEVTDSNSHNDSGESDGSSKGFYNPVTLEFNESNSNIDNASKTNNSYSNNSTDTFVRNKMYSFLKTNPQVMEEVNKVEMIYEKALSYLDTLFMVVL